MFHSARIKLTVWYLVIIMAISIFFSSLIYFGAAREFDRILRIEAFRTAHPQLEETYLQRPVWDLDSMSALPKNPPPESVVIIRASRIRALEGLGVLNLLIFFLSALFGWFLAGRTLRPIKNMVDEQNRFITDASHELNTPLTSLKTSIEVNLRDKKLSLEKAKEVLLSNLEEVNSLQALSDELIRITQYQRVNGNFNPKKINIKETVETAVSRIKPQASKKGIKISVSVPKLFVMADERSLTELFTILLDNAVKYSQNKKEVFVNVQSVDSKIKIGVKDNGIGIKKEDIPMIFDRFYRADKSRTKQEFKGYGLGLSIAKRIVDLHKGFIHVESQEGKGSEFIVLLPKAK